MEDLKSSENKMSTKLSTIESVKNVLLIELEKLKKRENDRKVEVEVKENEIRGLKRQVEELQGVVMTKNKEWEMVKDELQKRVQEMISKVAKLDKKLENLTTKRVIAAGVSVEWLLVATTTVAATILCYLRYGRKL
ncbi:hypothetical protein RND71_037205 [Anisodus tanguticus]|nr:hypothetical protein RND71_037205 [Anisodus tanguticus]